MSQFILACLLVDSVLCASTMLTRQGVSASVCMARHCMSVCICVRVGSPRLLVTVHCLQNGLKWSRFLKVVTFSAKKSRGCYHHSDMWRFPAILWQKSADFCYNRDEMIRFLRFSRVLSNPQVVGNAITSTITTLRCDKNG